ncbi:PD-(D/E)XK nuclease family protein [Metabacillus idriensis]|uniref:PD-(D/E)XK nuclease family protein n=1 Tax=Metabacillus idriensis TaxID=324768 RepID=UPI00174AF444|nr:PD-(D/E)XK nuclease family protein [Metabacillus idriensis]
MPIREHPEFQWSLSRHKILLECLFRYWLSYYASHNGWLRDSDTTTKHIYRLKKMTNLEMLLGELVHEYIEKIIKSDFNRHLINKKVMFASIWGDIEEVMEKSYRDYNRWYENPSKNKMLHEVYYENEIAPEKVQNLEEKLKQIVHNFMENKTFEEMVSRKVYIAKDTESFRYMKKGDIKIWLKMDLHYFDPMTNKRAILDWKTGNSNQADRSQLALYAHYISTLYKISDLDNIEIRNEYLLTDESKSYKLKKIDIDNMRELTDLSIAHMQSYLLDIEKNIPLDEAYFQKTNNQSVCSRCNFREICKINH